MTTEQDSRLLEITTRRSGATLHDLKARNRPDDMVGNSSVVADGRFITTDVPWGDADLFAHAHDDIDWLLARLAERDAAIERVRAKADMWVRNAAQPWAMDSDDVRAFAAEAILEILDEPEVETQ